MIGLAVSLSTLLTLLLLTPLIDPAEAGLSHGGGGGRPEAAAHVPQGQELWRQVDLGGRCNTGWVADCTAAGRGSAENGARR